MGWTPRRAAVWQDIQQSDYQGWFTALETHALYPSDGLREAMLYRITGDPQYAAQTWDALDRFCGASYDGGNCDVNWEGMCTSNCIRDTFPRAALCYSLVADGLPAADKADFKDVLTLWSLQSFGEADSAIPAQGIRVTDTDELLGGYFGLAIFALAIEQEDPALSAHILNHGPVEANGYTDETLAMGGFDATAADTGSTMRNAIAAYLERANGEWLESTRYNDGSVAGYLALGIDAINGHFGTNKFPEFDAAKYMELALAQLTPDREERVVWGDYQAPTRGLYLYRYVAFMGALSYLSQDPEGLFVFDELYAKNGGSGLPETFLWWVDPFLPRQAPSQTGATLQGEGVHGIALYRTGQDANDSLFSSTMRRYSYVDHDPRLLSHFGLYRQGAWALSRPRGYYSGNNQQEGYANNVWLGGIGASMREASGQSAVAAGDGYLYHAGLTAGNQKSSGTNAPPMEWVHEYNRSLVYLRHDDGSDSVVIYERVNSCDWLHDEDCMHPWRIAQLDHLTELRGCGQVYDGGCHPDADGKHKWLLHAHEAFQVDASDPDLRHWTVAGSQEEVFWKTFVPGYSFDQHSTADAHNQGFPYFTGGYMEDSELDAHVRGVLVPDQIEGFQSWLNVLHVGGGFASARIVGDSGQEIVEGVQLSAGSRDEILLFNATENTPPPPSSVNAPDCPGANGYCVIHNPERFAQTLALRRFRKGFAIDLNTAVQTRVLLLDLDPNREWLASLDGVAVPGLEVSPEGVAELSLDAPFGLRHLEVISTSQCAPQAWQGCDAQAECEANGWFWFDGACHPQPPDGYGDPLGPQVLTLTPSRDLAIKSNSTDQNRNGLGLEIKSIVEPWDEASLVDFDLSGIALDPGDTLVSATFQARASSTMTFGKTNYLYERKTPIDETSATWNESASGAPWQEPGCRGSLDMVGQWGSHEGALACIVQASGIAGSLQTYSSPDGSLRDYVEGCLGGEARFVIHQKTGDNSDVSYYDRENSVDLPCQLVITIQKAATPGQPYCFGDWTAGACPCDNQISGPGGCANSLGLGGRLRGLGSPSVAADDLQLVADGLTNQAAVLFVGTEATPGLLGIPTADGLRCVAGSIQRFDAVGAGAAGMATWGPNLQAQGGWDAGESRQFQVWYRDPGGSCGAGFNLTNALEVNLVP